MKFLFDLFPVFLLFSSYNWAQRHQVLANELVSTYLANFISGATIKPEQAPIILATAITMLATVLQILYLTVRRKKIDGMLWISFAIVTIFGGATIYFHNSNFLKWKPTVLYWTNAIVFLTSQYLFKKNLIKQLMGTQIQLPEKIWSNLNMMWIIYFIIMGALNRYVAFNFEESTWVSYKLYSLSSIFVIAIGQSLYLSKYMEEPNDKSA